jgi:hypothetical protein
MFQNKKYNQEKHATEITLLSSNENVMVTDGSRVVTGGSSSFIILFIVYLLYTFRYMVLTRQEGEKTC